MKKAIVLVSGGLHSTTALAIAASREYELYALSFDFGQKNKYKLEAAKKIAKKFNVKEHKIVDFNINSLLSLDKDSDEITNEILPARNNLFLSFALCWAEVIKVSHFFIGVNSIEYGDSPDCRPAFIHTFEKLANVSIKKDRTMRKINVWSPLMNTATADSIKKGLALGVDYSETFSCQDLDKDGNACGDCVSCDYRRDAFKEAGVDDPTIYRKDSISKSENKCNV